MLRLSKTSLPLITFLAIMLNGCVILVTSSAIAGKKILSDSETNNQISVNTKSEILLSEADASVKTLAPNLEERPKTTLESIKEITHTEPVAEKIMGKTKAPITTNQLELLNKSPWYVTSALSITNTSNIKDSVFVFTSNGIFRGFGGCNYFSGKFKANNQGDFLITALKSSNQACSKNNDDGTKVIKAIIMSNRFQIQDGTLDLLSDEIILMNLSQAQDVSVDQLLQKSINLKRRKQHSAKKSKISKLKSRK